jgi:hypothetical protein
LRRIDKELSKKTRACHDVAHPCCIFASRKKINIMTLYTTTFSLGMEGIMPQYVELTPDVIKDFLHVVDAFEKIGYSHQVISDLADKNPTVDDRIRALKKEYHLSYRQGLLVQSIPVCEEPLYFDEHEYYNQVKRLKKLQRLLKEMQDIQDKE